MPVGQIILTVAIGDFNANSNKWYAGATTNFGGSKVEAITSQVVLQ